MFYAPSNGHGLPHDPLKAIVAPRPIGWISTLDAQGRPNLAPYSFFAMLHGAPPLIAFASTGLKHSAANAQATGEFVFNLATMPLLHPMNMSSCDALEGEDEFALAGLTKAPSTIVKAPRVADTPAALECKVTQSMLLQDINGQDTNGVLIIGQVVGVHIDERYLRDGRFDTAAAQPLVRCGYHDYAVVNELFELRRPARPS